MGGVINEDTYNVIDFTKQFKYNILQILFYIYQNNNTCPAHITSKLSMHKVCVYNMLTELKNMGILKMYKRDKHSKINSIALTRKGIIVIEKLMFVNDVLSKQKNIKLRGKGIVMIPFEELE